MNSMATISIEDLSVVRGGREVLHRLDLEIEPGSVTGLLGPSGSGKSTLIRAIVGVQIVARGRVTVLGLAAGSAALRRRVGYVTQAPAVYDDLTIRENLEYFARIVGVGHDRVEAVIDRVGLRGQRDQVAATGSGGERARLSLATALLHEPEVLVLDEPTVGLDPVLRRDLWAFFRELADGGSTLLVSSHVMDEAALCQQLILIRDGDVLAVETPDELREQTGERDLDAAFLHLIEGHA
ncbi:MAG TPA: ABC transporter ATP-binding protein [Gaiellaceae bacterium]|nr:ABC transporter ATP-binding protein [Gaiellaceae bacterium]